MIVKKSYLLLFVVALVLLIYSFYSETVASFDLNIGDTYYVTSMPYFYRIYSILLLIVGLLYLTLDKNKVELVEVLSLLHIYGTLISYLFLVYFNYYSQLEYQEQNFQQLFERPDYNYYLIITLLTLTTLQILFIINIFVSVIKKLRTV